MRNWLKLPGKQSLGNLQKHRLNYANGPYNYIC